MEKTAEKVRSKIVPDVALEEKSDHPSCIDWVGMQNIECPMMITDEDNRTHTVKASIDVEVNVVSPTIKGIHMSRLYNDVTESLSSTVLSLSSLKQSVLNMTEGHKGISDACRVKVSFSYPLKQVSLLSGNVGWRYYPLSLEIVHKNKAIDVIFGMSLAYSSTCPCSAALSRDLLVQNVDQAFENETIEKEDLLAWLSNKDAMGGVPHAQRSEATIHCRFSDTQALPNFSALISAAESALGTPVQAYVKRVDEQEFSKRNAEHLMFCEDAVRVLNAYFNSRDDISDYKITVCHHESLHPHDAVATVVKGVPGGFLA